VNGNPDAPIATGEQAVRISDDSFAFPFSKSSCLFSGRRRTMGKKAPPRSSDQGQGSDNAEEQAPEAKIDEKTAMVFAKTVSKAMGPSLHHKRATSTDVEVYVKSLFEAARHGSAANKLDQHVSATRTASRLKKTDTLKAVHLEKTPYGKAALQDAAFAGQVEEVGRLVRQGYDVNERYSHGETPLHVAAESGHALMALELLHHDADLLARDKDGWTPLHHAALQGHLECVEALTNWAGECNSDLKTKALSAVDSEGGTPLHAAVHMRNYTATPVQVAQLRSVVKFLVAAGADPNAADCNGWRPLHMAVQTGHVALLEELMAAGADDLTEDNAGKLPIDYACNSKGTKFRSLDIGRILAAAAAVRTPSQRGDRSPSPSCPNSPLMRSPLSSPPRSPRSPRPLSPMLWDTSAIERERKIEVEPVDLSAAAKDNFDLTSNWTKRLSTEGAGAAGSDISSEMSDPPTPTLSAVNSMESVPVVKPEAPEQASSFADSANDDSSLYGRHTATTNASSPSKTGGGEVLLPYQEEGSLISPRLAAKLNNKPIEQRETMKRASKPAAASPPMRRGGMMRPRVAQPYSVTLKTSDSAGHLAPTASSVRKSSPQSDHKSTRQGGPVLPPKPKASLRTTTRPGEKPVVHYTSKGIPYVYELENNHEVVNYQNPTFRRTNSPR